MNEFKLKELESLISKVKGKAPDLNKKHRNDIFSISGFPHYETVLSNWFCFFFESYNNHGLSGLFSDCFRQVLIKKGSNMSFDWLNDKVHVNQEVITNSGNFIDIVVFDSYDKENKEYENALIIEHKVEAQLYNDLIDYYTSIETEGEKQGLVLSAQSLDTKNDLYINITYNELIESVRNNLGKYVEKVDLIYLGYLKEFMNNLERMSEQKNIEALQFCFDYGETIEKISELKRSMEDELANWLRSSLEKSDFYFFRKNPTSYSLKSNTGGIVILLEFGKLFSEHKCDFSYWLQGEIVKEWNTVPDIIALKEKFGNEFEIRPKKEGKEWVEILRGNINFIDVPNLAESFDKELVDYLNNKIKPINEFIQLEISKYNR